MRSAAKKSGGIVMFAAAAVAAVAYLAYQSGRDARSDGGDDDKAQRETADSVSSPAYAGLQASLTRDDDRAADAALLARFQERYSAGYRELASESAPRARTTFERSPALSRRVERDFIAEYRALPTITREDVARDVGSGEALSRFQAEMRSYGLDPDDLADVMAMYHGIHWAIVNGTPTGVAELRAMRDRLARVLPRDASTRALDDAQKQEAADRYALLTSVHDAHYAALVRQGDAPTQLRYREAVHRDFLRRSGLDLRRYALTREGFIARR